MFQSFPLQEISSAAIWVPLIFAGLRLKGGDRKILLFFLFLLFGAVTDGLGWMAYVVFDFSLLRLAHLYVQFFYLWFEALLFIWLAFEFLNVQKKQYWRRFTWIGVSVLFALDGMFRFVLSNPIEHFSSFVYSGILVLSSFLMAFALLRIAEQKEEILKEPWFWILSGIFFYSFSCFFIDMLTFTDYAEGLWRIRVVFNMIQYLFFVVGLLKFSKNNGQ